MKEAFRSSVKILILVMIFVGFSGCSSKPETYNVVWITLDTTRADYVDTGGEEGSRAFTPELKRFAMNSIVFEQAFCSIPQTLPSHLSMFTSCYPTEFGVLSNEHKFNGNHKTITQVFKEKGYYTAGITSLGTLASSTGFSKGFDLFLEDLREKYVFFAPAEKVTDEGLKVLNSTGGKPFFLFLHYSDPHTPYAPPSEKSNFKILLDGKEVSTFNAYFGALLRLEIPFTPGKHTVEFQIEKKPEDFNFCILRRLTFSPGCTAQYTGLEFSKEHYNGSYLMKNTGGKIIVNSKGNGMMNLFQVIPVLNRNVCVENYRKEVEYMDGHVGRFLRALEKKELLKNTIVVIEADHGEGLGERERYFGHVGYLNSQFIHVPLIIHFPGEEARRISSPVSLGWISPALLQYMNITDPAFKDKKSLLPFIRDPETAPKNTPIYSYVFRPSALEDRFSVINWPYQAIYNNDVRSPEPEMELYSLTISQAFRKLDVYAPEVLMKVNPDCFRFFQQSLADAKKLFLGRANISTQENKKEIDKLKSLGYLQ